MIDINKHMRLWNNHILSLISKLNEINELDVQFDTALLQQRVNDAVSSGHLSYKLFGDQLDPVNFGLMYGHSWSYDVYLALSGHTLDNPALLFCRCNRFVRHRQSESTIIVSPIMSCHDEELWRINHSSVSFDTNDVVRLLLEYLTRLEG